MEFMEFANSFRVGGSLLSMFIMFVLVLNAILFIV